MVKENPTFDLAYKPDGLSVVIPNYNGVELFKNTLKPLLTALNNTGLPWETIVVDDCSTDNSISFLRHNYPWIKVLTNEQNLGFSKTINKGIFAAKYDLILLLNSDIIVAPDYFSGLFKYFSDPKTFGVGGRIIGWDDDFIQDAARLPSFQLCKLKINQHYIVKNSDQKPVLTLYLSGSSALVNRKKLVELGGFSDIFSPFYAEDLDLSVRAWRKGWHCYYAHEAICRHKTSASIKSKERKKYIDKIYFRNKMFFHAVHLSAFEFSIYMIQITMESFLKILLLRPVLLQSLLLFVKERHKWIAARKYFNEKISGHEVRLTLRQVVKNIRKSVNKRAIITFRTGQLSSQ
jgi:GT2 family glycosyltransferase